MSRSSSLFHNEVYFGENYKLLFIAFISYIVACNVYTVIITIFYRC